MLQPLMLRTMMFEQSPQAMVVFDRAMRVVECNDALARVFGISRNRIVGLHIDDLRDRRFRASIERALAGEVVQYESSYHATTSDTWFWGGATFSPLRDASGEVVAVLGIVSDRTLGPAATDSIASCEMRLVEAQRLGRFGNWTWERERDTIDASREFYRILGVAPSQVSGLPSIERLVHGQDRASVWAHFAKQIAERAPFTTCEFRMSSDDTRARWAIMRAEMRYSDDGRLISAWGTLQDVTDRREIEEQLRRAQRMETLGQLAAGVAHDFNNLLTVIQVESEFVQNGLADNDSLHADVREIRKAVERAGALTRQLLAFSRRQILRPRVLDLNELVAEISSMLRRVIGEDVDLITDPAPDLPLIVADPGQLHQVLLNLAVNARDAMPEGGTLRFSTASAVVDEHDPLLSAGSYCVLTVADTGHGIAADVRHRIFDPFFTTKPIGKGTGLGLATVIGIVEQTGGKIFVSSEPGRGARFTIYLPCADDASVADTAAVVMHLRRARRPATVLLVEDERPLRSVVQHVLEAGGYTVLTAEEGFEGIAVAETYAGTIDLLITDVVLPGLSGRELATRLLHRRPELQVLYVSGYTDEEILRRGLFDPGMA
ncbi:MAG TPA: PAS domain S-box protein, partial [Acidimicrobiales bacterium]